ncbi:chemotaxis protein CheD [Chitinilyticum piscinae]|uniref:Probable chemoreceptor glutamine deamidase CheD n=1 Tax=Chitinilyticum piscinae TaxID=2866724 RepID=A0A8J7FP43_9NEIS|nr:chemotaxis protein CheD [Chitinilyticum piscinae]MBE9609644.1 chemotaxis protein CheD [Chitinilyticum piscinae]
MPPSPAPAHPLHYQSPRQLEKLARVIHAGEVAVETARPIATLLGSCISVCLYDAKRQAMGMNHFILPDIRRDHTSATDRELSGMASLELLVNAMLKAGCSKQRLVAKVFGGAQILPCLLHNVGIQNIDFTYNWLRAERIPVQSADVGEQLARKIVANPANGDVFCRHIAAAHLQHDLQRREQAYAEQLQIQLAQRQIRFF